MIMDFDEALDWITSIRHIQHLGDHLKMRCVWARCPHHGEQWAFVPVDGWRWPQQIVCPKCGVRWLRADRWLEWNE